MLEKKFWIRALKGRCQCRYGLWCQGPARGLFDLWFFRERLARKEVALGEEVGSGSGGATQERAGVEEGVDPVSKEEEAGEEV